MLRIFAHTTLVSAALLLTFAATPSQSDALRAAEPAAAQSPAPCSHCGNGCNTCNQCGRMHGSRNQCGTCQTLNCRPRQYGQPQLFSNYYLPGNCGGMPAQLYVAPRPVPAGVGQTYFTYQPFQPHELLYQHKRTYYRYYDNGRGMNRTRVSWYRPMIPGTLSGVAQHFRLAK